MDKGILRFAPLLAAAGLSFLSDCSGAGGPCDPEGTRLARVSYPVRDLAVSDRWVYWLDPERVTDSSVRGVLMRVPAEGGAAQRLAASDAPEALLRNHLVVSGGTAFWLDPCPTPAPTCARIVSVPVAGGTPTVLVQGRVFAFAVHGDDLFFTLSDEWGLQEGAPDGEVRRMPATGGASVVLRSGLTHLREVLADDDRVYWSVATSGDDAGRRAYVQAMSRADGTVSTLLDNGGAGGARPGYLALSGGYLYFVAWGRVHRVPAAGGAVEDLGDPQARSIADLAVQGGTLLLADWGEWVGTTDDDPGTYQCGAILGMVPGTGVARVLAGGQEQPTAVAAAPGWVYWVTEGYADWHDGGIYRMPLPPM